MPEKRVILVLSGKKEKPACLENPVKMEPLVTPDQTEKMVRMEPRENQVLPENREKLETRAPKVMLEPLE